MQRISAEDWRQLFALLDTALELPPAARESWLATLAIEPAHLHDSLRGLLARHETGDFLAALPQFTVTPDDAVAEDPDAASVPECVGPYRLIARLGRGGMSSVWVAERIDGLLKRRVALKLPHVSWGPELAERMARERDILASLEHPNIARLYDAGLAEDGRPFLALELVEGKAVDDYCNTRNADVRARLTIALQTARAVAYAHSRMVVHRDLKPSNILVDPAGQVHLLDFGIGKLLEEGPAAPPQATQFGGRAFTPAYASPEQLRADPVTASTDVYSFGVVLYQLLCGSLPHPADASSSAFEPGAVRAAPKPPSAATRDRERRQSLRGDLDTIVMKALKSSPPERYSGMQAVADDLERYLRGERVLARPDTAWYRARKFAGRNRLVIGAMAAATAITVAIAIGLGVQKSRQQRVETAQAIDAFSDQLAQLTVPRTPPTKDDAAYHEYLQARGIMIVPTEANLREVIRLTKSATTRDPRFAQAYAVLAGGYLMHLDNAYPRPDALLLAEPAAREAVALNPRIPGAHASLGVIAAHRRDWHAAEAHFTKAFAVDDGTGRIHSRYAEAVLNSTGRLREALRLFRSELRKTPTHCRGAMQVAVGLGMTPGNDREAMNYVDIAISHGWPADARDVEKLEGEIARRAGRYADAADHDVLVLPAATRAAGGDAAVRLLYAGLANPAERPAAIAALDALNARGAAAGMDSFPMLMFSMTWYTMLDDLDRAYLVGERWRAESARTGLAGIPFNFGFWQQEMHPFRTDPRFSDLMRRLGLMRYWRDFGAPDDCRLQGETLACD